MPISMERTAPKKALVILTNEAFLPKASSRSARRLNNNGTQQQPKEKGPMVSGSPSSWISPQPTILETPQTYDSIEATSAAFAHGHECTGVDIFELGYLWMTLRKEHKMEIVFSTPRGGPVAADPISVERMEKDSKLRDEIRKEPEFMLKMGHTLPIGWVKPEEFQLVILTGGHGAMFDLPEHEDVACVINEIYSNNGIIAAIGHGVAGLLNVRLGRRGEHLLKGKRVTCFSKEEERKFGYESYLPFVLEDRVRERGAKLEVKKPFEPHVVADNRLITAQSAPSIHEFVTRIAEEIANL